jgi:signal transduction histidine kinase
VRPRIQLAFLFLVLVPIGLLAFLGFRVARDEKTLVAREIETAERARLLDLGGSIARTVDQIERRFLAKLESVNGAAPEDLRALARKEPLFRQPFSVAADGRLVFPDGFGSPSVRGGRASDLSDEERSFLVRTRSIWAGEAELYAPPAGEDATSSTAKKKRTDDVVALASARASGWIVWYWEEGPHLLFWRRRPEGGVMGAEIERIAMLSQIISSVPALDSREGTTRLLDAKNEAIAEWGEDADGAGGPIASVALSHPLDFMRLEFVPSARERDALSGRTFNLGMLFGLAAILLALSIAAIYFHRESTRALRDAAERVSFVTQVSHELKTPLTNVRLYAELLEDRLGDSDEDAQRQLGVIISESQRLGRLINNILSFSKHRQNKLSVSQAPVVIDEVVEGVLEQFEPLFQAKGIEAEAKLSAPHPVPADKDAIGQILANLLSNVEKYAAVGKHVEIESKEEPDALTVTVRDRGPGIASAHRTRIFDPFYRVSDKLADGVTGTGIGLTIARELARLHGGDLLLLASERGSTFQLTLPRPGKEART